MSDQPSVPQIRVTLPDELAGGHYADFVRVWHGKDIFTLDFAALLAPPGPDGTTARVVSRVRIPPSQVFEIMKALERSLTAWESDQQRG
ncbi:DUF3467 domain-containing protein [Aquipuribacter nitratireducens]|uniref:DUF3467 domain-containing protein n=1 Tax=Aquipuribacter nitratireducens TaxID=650104 RepID=A0ABW0GN76_9MICO